MSFDDWYMLPLSCLKSICKFPDFFRKTAPLGALGGDIFDKKTGYILLKQL